MRNFVALFGAALFLVAIGCSGGEETSSTTTGTAPNNLNSMKTDDPTKGTIPGKADFTAVKASLESFCYPCHNAQNKKDDVNIEGLASAEDLKKVSSHIIEVLESKKMPPANAGKQPTDDERSKLVSDLKNL